MNLNLAGVTTALSTTSSTTTKHAPNILIGVVTSPWHQNARKSIRETWGIEAAQLGIPVKFFIGRLSSSCSVSESELQEEATKYGDVVRLTEFTESYHNLTSKAIGIFEYGYDNGYRGVFKVDDDSYLRVHKLVRHLSSYPDLEHLFSGSFIRGNPVGRVPNTRWYAFDQYPHERYPPYTNGPGFFLGRSGLQYIATNKNTLNRIRVDDAAVGVWMQDLGGMHQATMDASSFSYHPSGSSIWVGPLSAKEMLKIHSGAYFTPEVCNDSDKGCMCHGNPRFSGHEVSQCWERFANSPYKDYIPRHANN